jgi:hypothetical protein
MGDPNYPDERKKRVIGRLESIGASYPVPVADQYVNCLTKIRINCCMCSAEISVLPSNLLKRGSVSCKKCKYILIGLAMKKYKAPSWFQQRYGSIKQRCTKPDSKHYKNYGGRGICIEFNDVDAMWEYMKSLPNYSETLTIDRIDNDKNYAKGNLRWASHLIQNNNQRRVVEGVRQVNGSPRFQARITIDSKEVYLGTFKTHELARAAVITANRRKIHEYETR